MKKLSDLFDHWYGANLELVNCQINDKGIPFVSRTSNNNGVVARVELIPGVEPNPAHTLSLAGGGSVLSCFYQDEEYYSGRDLFILSPKEFMTKNEMLLYSYIIEANKYKYNYGRQSNKTFRDLMLPELSELKEINLNNINPDFKFNKSAEQNNTLRLNTNMWKWFKLVPDIFHYSKGKRLTKADSIEGDIPLVTAGENNQGINRFVDNDMDIFSYCITIDMFGFCVYRGYEFCCDDNILVLIPKDKISKYTMMFIVTLINQDQYKYAYGRQYRQKTLLKHKIKLPVDSKGDPDWQFMEDYIKSLPYSVNL